MKYRLATAIFLYCTMASAAGQVTLDQVLDQVQVVAPEQRVKALIAREAILQSDALGTRKLPAIAFSTQATYQSDVTSLPLDLPGMDIPSVPHLQFKVQAELQQSVYDGGTTTVLQEGARNAAALADADADMQFEWVREQAIRLFFGLIELQSARNILSHKEQRLSAQRATLQSRVEQGVVLASELHTLDAALLELGKEQTSLETQAATLRDQLGLLTGTPAYDSTTVFEMPAEPARFQAVSDELPTYRILAGQHEGIAIDLARQEAAARPRVDLFGQFGLGQPGLNVLDDELSGLYILGLRARLPLSRLYTRRKEVEIARIASEKVNAARTAFNRQLDMQIMTYTHEIEMYDRHIASNIELLGHREQITRTAQVQLDNGAINSADYISVLNEENTAREQLALSRVRKCMTQHLLNHVTGYHLKNE
ncbi:MAG: TolC family protein [Saprospiraceae bacterium]|nr:TolC family protein [Saprospiraceae bacterium]